jgi:hypothetical protein
MIALHNQIATKPTRQKCLHRCAASLLQGAAFLTNVIDSVTISFLGWGGCYSFNVAGRPQRNKVLLQDLPGFNFPVIICAPLGIKAVLAASHPAISRFSLSRPNLKSHRIFHHTLAGIGMSFDL